jgi:hypothetical protein
MDANTFVHHDFIPFKELVCSKPITTFSFRRSTCLYNINACLNRCLTFKALKVPNVTVVSLCHLAEDLQMQLASSTSYPDKSAERAQSQLPLDHVNLPQGQTDWDAKMKEVLVK